MENKFTEEEKPNYIRRRLGVLLVVAVFFTILGRHMTFLPTINLSMNSQEEDLKKEVGKIIEGKTGSYSIYYKNLETGASFGINENQIHKGASINKVPIVASLYKLADAEKIKLDERVTIQESDVQDYGTGTIRYQEMPQNYSLRNLAKLALNQSDNTAAHVIDLKIGEENVQTLVDDWGMKQTNMVENQTSVADLSIIFQKIFNNEITTEANTKEFLSYMTDTDFEDRITKDLPSGTTSYHKTGDDEGYTHDAGIIVTPNATYFLGIMTSDIGGKEDETKNIMSEISLTIYKELNN